MRATIGALAAALTFALAGCAGGSGDPGLRPAPAPAEGEYNPQPYDNIRDGGTYTPGDDSCLEVLPSDDEPDVVEAEPAFTG